MGDEAVGNVMTRIAAGSDMLTKSFVEQPFTGTLPPESFAASVDESPLEASTPESPVDGLELELEQ
jgi:hypothetical protein